MSKIILNKEDGGDLAEFQEQLQACYLEANQELNDDFDATTADGLSVDE